MVYVFLADGFEEIEALTPVDVLRRANIPVCTVGIGSDSPRGAHNITVKADCREDVIDFSDMTGVVLPGGMPGTLNLEASDTVQRTICYAREHGVLTAAICAAPSILGHAGYLKGYAATCYPGFEDTLDGANIHDKAVVVDRTVITSRGAGTALEFALSLVAYLRDPATAEEIRGAIQCR